MQLCGARVDFVDGVRGWDWSLQHRRPRGMGGTRLAEINSPANLLLLCGSATTGCHGYVERERAAALHAGWLVPSSSDPTRDAVLICRELDASVKR